MNNTLQSLAIRWLGNFYGERGDCKFTVCYTWGDLEITMRRKKSSNGIKGMNEDIVILEEK